jgi:hypothetical protein
MSEAPVSPSNQDRVSLCVGSHQFFISEDLDALVVQPGGSDPDERPLDLLRIERGQTLDDALRNNQASDGFIAIWVELSANEQCEVRTFWNKALREVWVWRQVGSLLAEIALLISILEAYACYRHGLAPWGNWVEFVFIVLWVPAIATLSQLIARFLLWPADILFKWLLRLPANSGRGLRLASGMLLGLSVTELTRRSLVLGEMSLALAVMSMLRSIVILAVAVVVIKVFHGAWHNARLLIRARVSKR